MKIIIDNKVHRAPLIIETKDEKFVDLMIYNLCKMGANVIVPEAAIMSYRSEKENHFHIGGKDCEELGDLTEEVIAAVIEELRKDD